MMRDGLIEGSRAGVLDDFLDPPATADLDRALAAVAITLERGAAIGAYRIERAIAAGGMGCVYRAHRADGQDDQVVAIKVIAGGRMNPDTRRRLRRERQILARLEHPGITRLLDGGATPDGLPYLVMELVEGDPIDRHCHRVDASLPERLRLFREVCAAVAHAHRHLIVHRDIKPANVLVTAEGRAKLLDFGVAGLLAEANGSTDATATAGPAPLTLAYASPEQVRGERATTASDVYGLGGLLYHLLAGRSPHALGDRSPLDAMRIVCDEVPRPPSAAAATSGRNRRWCAAIRGDLDRIVLTALRQEPTRRYATVEQLEDDVRRFLERRPVLARGDDLWYRAQRFAQRNRVVATAAAIATLFAVAGVAAMAAGFVHARAATRAAEHGRIEAVRARDAARETVLFFQELLASANPYRHGRSATVQELMADTERRIDRGFASDPQVEAGVRVAMARTCAALMMWPEAARQGERAVTLLRTVRGDSLPLAEALSLLGRAWTHLHEPGAIAAQEEALAIRRERLGSDHALTAESTGNLGFALWASTADANEGDARRGLAGAPGAEHDRAETSYLEALATFERVGAGSTRDAARMTMSLGYFYDNRQRFDEALCRYEAALAIYRGLEFTDDLYELATLSLCAGLLERDGRLDEALAHLEAYRRLVPVDLPAERTSSINWRIAALCDRLGMRVRTRAELHAALAHECRVLAAEHPDADGRLDAAARGLLAPSADGAAVVEALEVVTELDGLRGTFLRDGLCRLAALAEVEGDLATADAIMARLDNSRARVGG